MNKVMIGLWTAILVFISGSCATQKINYGLRDHVDKFYRVAAEMGYPVNANRNLTVKFYKFEKGGPAGQCKSYQGDDPEVRVNAVLEDMAQSYEVEYIVFHELGHCLLGIDHDSTMVLGHPFSMMHPTMMDISHYAHNREAYWREMFSRPRGELWR